MIIIIELLMIIAMITLICVEFSLLIIISKLKVEVSLLTKKLTEMINKMYGIKSKKKQEKKVKWWCKIWKR